MVTEIEKMLIRQKPYVKAFHDDNGQDMLLAGDVDLVLEYNGDIAQAMKENPDLDFVVPKEGSLLNSDTLCIPKGAPRPDNAHKFINYLLDAQAGAEISKTILYPTPNAAAKALMPPEYSDNPVIFPPAAILAKCEYGGVRGGREGQSVRGSHHPGGAGVVDPKCPPLSARPKRGVGRDRRAAGQSARSLSPATASTRLSGGQPQEAE